MKDFGEWQHWSGKAQRHVDLWAAADKLWKTGGVLSRQWMAKYIEKWLHNTR